MKKILILILLLSSIGFSDQCDKIEGSQEFIDCKVKMVEENDSKPTGWIGPFDNVDLTKFDEYQIQPDMRRYFTLVQQEASLDVSSFTFGVIGLGAGVTALLAPPKYRTPLLVMSVVSCTVSFGFEIGRIVTVKQIEVFAIKYNKYHQLIN